MSVLLFGFFFKEISTVKIFSKNSYLTSAYSYINTSTPLMSMV